MERPKRLDYVDDAGYEEAKEKYRLHMVSFYEEQTKTATGRDLTIVKQRLSYWKRHAAILENARRYAAGHKKELLDKSREYHASHVDSIRARSRMYRELNHDAILKRESSWRDENRELLNKRARDRYHRDPEKARAANKKWRDAHRVEKEPVVCPICGNLFIKSNGEQKYCSKECFAENRRMWRKKWYSSRTDEQKKAILDRSSKHAKSDKAKARRKEYAMSDAGKAARKKAIENYKHSEKGKAAKVRYEKTEAYKAARHRHDIRRRARKAIAALVEVDTGIHWTTLSKRLGTMKCAMCGVECDPNGEPSIRPTVDHIIPISKGGTHTWDNVQLLCMRCNSGKCANMPVQDQRQQLASQGQQMMIQQMSQGG